ncbi:MAG: B12-binding domain-containing radical SAM protein [Calditrichia bacterium]
MKIALISPKGPLYRHRTGIFRKSLRVAPLTLTTLASLVPEKLNAEIILYDEGIEDLPERIDADLVGMTVITGTAPRAYELAKQFQNEGKTVVLGGPHVTLLPEEAQLHADSIVTGYAEESWPLLLHDYKSGQLKPRYDMSPDFSFNNMPSIPFAKRDMLDKRAFKSMNTFEATRGCVHKCDFCVVPSAWGRKPFLKPVQHVVEDIRQLGAKHLVFYDLNIIADRRYAKQLFTALIPLRIKWFGLATTLIVEDEELLNLLARSGCRGLLIGFESLSTGSLADSNKRFNRPHTYAAVVETLHRLGIAINGTFVFGNDSDSLESFSEVRDFVMSTGIDLPRFSLLTPFPGTPLFKQLETQQRIISRDWSLYDGQHVVFEPAQMSATELLNGHEKIWRDVYGYKNMAIRNTRRLQHRLKLLPVIVAANIGYRYYAQNLSTFYNCLGGAL